VRASPVVLRVAARIDRHRFATLTVIAAAIIYSAAIRAAAKPFWHDEIFTILLADLPSLTDVWGAMHDGVDLAPPLTTLLTRVVRGWLGEGPIVTRLVPIASFVAMLFVLFEFVRRRSNATAAVTAALFPILTAAYRHSYEARAYALMMALFAIALFAWAEAAAGRSRTRNLILLALALAAGMWNHYYAVLTYVPVACGEAVRTWRSRQLDRGVFAAVALSVVPSLPMLALASAASAQSATFWSPASFDQIVETYYFLLEPLFVRRFAVVLIILLVVIGLSWLKKTGKQAEPHQLPPHETAALLAAVLVPIAGVLLGVFVTGVFVPRYALPAVAGISLLVALAIPRSTRAELVLPLVLLVSTAELLFPVARIGDPFEARPVLVDALKSPGPTAITGGLTYLQLWYYAPAALKPRLVYIADPSSARRLTGSDTIDLGLLALSRWTTVGAVPFAGFRLQHRTFRVYAYGSGWLLDRLRESGAELEEREAEASAQLYIVRLRAAD
jgi:hypothetical protein